MIMVISALTALVLQPPLMGTWSTVGGAGLLTYFLLVQPAGVSLREVMAAPDRRPVRSTWVEPEQVQTVSSSESSVEK